MRLRLLLVVLLAGCRLTDSDPIVKVYVTPNAGFDPTRPIPIKDSASEPGRLRTTGDSIQLFAVALTAGNQVIRWRDAQWSSSDTAVATVTSQGFVRVRTLGSVTIRATIDGVTGSASYVLPDCRTGFLSVTPSNATIAVGETQRFVVTAYSPLPPECFPVATWSLSNTAVASIDSTGLATGLAPGQATVIASLKADPGVKGAAVLTVK